MLEEVIRDLGGTLVLLKEERTVPQHTTPAAAADPAAMIAIPQAADLPLREALARNLTRIFQRLGRRHAQFATLDFATLLRLNSKFLPDRTPSEILSKSLAEFFAGRRSNGAVSVNGPARRMRRRDPISARRRIRG